MAKTITELEKIADAIEKVLFDHKLKANEMLYVLTLIQSTLMSTVTADFVQSQESNGIAA